jgi:hypothetical protein
MEGATKVASSSPEVPSLSLFVIRPRGEISYAELVQLIERRNLMATPSIAPDVKLSVEKKTMQVWEPKPPSLKQRVQNLLVEIFGRHEEFLGWTPD